ncbi:hypothetical protein F5B18DRAFT_635864 [Nemania serpens]|nr:hypothetical protein F5B18DRAFT_635864 [Nemania serpens]
MLSQVLQLLQIPASVLLSISGFLLFFICAQSTVSACVRDPPESLPPVFSDLNTKPDGNHGIGTVRLRCKRARSQ